MLRPKYNFEFSDIDKLREIVTEKKNKYNYLFIFSMILLVLTLVLSIIFAIFNHHFLCLMFFFFFTTSFIPIHICCNVEEIYKHINNMNNRNNRSKSTDLSNMNNKDKKAFMIIPGIVILLFLICSIFITKTVINSTANYIKTTATVQSTHKGSKQETIVYH